MTFFRSSKVWFLPGIFLASLLLTGLAGSTISAAETQEEFNIKGGAVQKDNIFNLFFGPVPMMPTQRGTVIVEAYHDANGNQRRDPGEEKLDKAVTCILDEVEYSIPAFIPGLENGMNYTILFEGGRFQPAFAKKDVFIKKRGQIIRIDLPCREATQHASLLEEPEGKH
jgi:hypothetical protein